MIVVGLGGNLGSREAYLGAARLLLAGRDDVTVTRRSWLYLTPPLGPPQPDYLNAALRLETALHPTELLEVLLGIERALGRVRRERWGPRVIDLDLLFWDGGEVRTDALVIPHPGLADRPFAIAPLLDVAPELADRYRCALPRRRAWASTPGEALDALDALAIEATERLGRPTHAHRVEPFEGELPREGPGFVVIERWDAQAHEGSKLL